MERGAGQHVAVTHWFNQSATPPKKSVNPNGVLPMTTANGLTTIPSTFGPTETMRRLVAEIEARGAKVMAHIDHAAAAEGVGMALRPTDLLIFGNPRGGTPLMQAQQTIGIDLPLKVLVWEDGDGRTWLTYNQPAWLAARHTIDVGRSPAVATMADLLAAVADAATTGVRAGNAPPIGTEPSSWATRIHPYHGGRDQEVAALVLGIQDDEAGLNLTIDDQPDLLDIAGAYREGGFWVAVDTNERIVGTIGLLHYGRTGVLKKLFVAAPYRGQGGPAEALLATLLDHARRLGLTDIVLDTPAVAARSHAFYERHGFRPGTAEDLPLGYNYPDRQSRVFRLQLVPPDTI
jgi:uncharacterized protein (DUF302 family)/GNAT superfamily N-acetyltransferase